MAASFKKALAVFVIAALMVFIPCRVYGEENEYSIMIDECSVVISINTDDDYALVITKDGVDQVHKFSDDVVVPLTLGEGEYEIKFYRRYQYERLETYSVHGEENDYLAPNRYVDYDDTCPEIIKALEIDQKDISTEEKIEKIAKQIRFDFHYSYIKVYQVTRNPGYVPDLHELGFLSGAICYDYASAFAGALRSIGIPCRLCMGYVGKSYHAWNEYYLNGEWVFIDLLNVSKDMNRYQKEFQY